MAFEDLLPEVGDKGRFQILQVFFFAIPMILIGSHFLLENFTAFVPEHRCWVHFLDNTSALLNVSGNLNFSSLLKFSIPLDSNGNPEKCRRFFWPQWQSLGPNVTGQNVSQLEMEPCVDGWVYDQSIFTSSIVTEWDLVCDSQTLKSFSQSIFLAGNLVGYLIWGYLSDRFGRKGMLLPNFLMLAVSSTGTAFVQSFPVYCCFRFLFGSSVTGIMVGSGTLTQEWTTNQHRPMVTVIFTLCFSMGHLFLGFVAYGIQEWRKFQLVMSAPFFAFFLASWWLPESARWLIVQNRYDEALKVLTKVAKINGVKETTLTIEVRGEGGARAGMWEMVAFQAKPSSQGPTKRKDTKGHPLTHGKFRKRVLMRFVCNEFSDLCSGNYRSTRQALKPALEGNVDRTHSNCKKSALCPSEILSLLSCCKEEGKIQQKNGVLSVELHPL
uniref:Major facilitator superfamily (MFS) profile domain-containing protein n=1 Tax=Vombatus ursinus TaxID=29139 RepID=A0A4X2K8B5_VOMUR